MAKISVVIPVHEMDNWKFFLDRCLSSIYSQNYGDYEVVISNDSIQADERTIGANHIERWVAESRYYPYTFVRRQLSEPKGMPTNSNRAIESARGELIKVIYMDDYLAHGNALQEIVDNFTKESAWLVTGCLHDDGTGPKNYHAPSYNALLYTGVNTVGSPSVLTLRREGHLLFDTSLSFLLDCDLYKRLHDTYGPPVILNTPNVAIGLHRGQTTNIMSEQAKEAERLYLLEKYK